MTPEYQRQFHAGQIRLCMERLNGGHCEREKWELRLRHHQQKLRELETA